MTDTASAAPSDAEIDAQWRESVEKHETTAAFVRDFARTVLAKWGAPPQISGFTVPQADSVTAPAGGIPGNFITHRAAWRKALETAKAHAAADDVSYWDHELRAFDRSFDRLWALMQDTSPQPTQAQAGTLESAEFVRFLSDVLTAAGLVTHGKQCKALGERLADMCAKLRHHGIKGDKHGL